MRKNSLSLQRNQLRKEERIHQNTGVSRPVQNGLGRGRAQGVAQLLGARTPTAGPGGAAAGIVLCHNQPQLSTFYNEHVNSATRKNRNCKKTLPTDHCRGRQSKTGVPLPPSRGLGAPVTPRAPEQPSAPQLDPTTCELSAAHTPRCGQR